MKLFCSVTVLLVMCFCGVRPALAWDKYAHEVIAQIAYDRLTPIARAEADSLITAMNSDPHVTEEDGKYKPYNFVSAAAWMDDMRSTTREFNSWHYVDLPFDSNLTKEQLAAFHDDNPSNCYHALTTFCIPTLKQASAPLAERARALGFLLHLAGDIHQPLHAIGRELGGNKYEITELAAADPTWKITNLHSFWDNAYRYGAVGAAARQPTDNHLDLPRPQYPGQDPVEEDACYIMANYAPTDRTAAQDIDPADWALESQKIAVNFAFPADGAHTLSPVYIQKAHDVACRRIALAGMRMAALLNQLLESKSL